MTSILPGATAIAGIGQTEFSKESGRSELQLACEAVSAALDDAGLAPSDVDGMVTFTMDSSDEIDIVGTPSTSMIGVTYNTTLAPFDDPKVRQAASLAIDRQAALDILQRGEGVFGGPVVPGPWQLDAATLEAIPGYGKDAAANLERAKALMAEAGAGDGLKIRMLVRRIALFEPGAPVRGER